MKVIVKGANATRQHRKDNAPRQPGRPAASRETAATRLKQRLERRGHRIGASHLRQALQEGARVQRQRQRHIAGGLGAGRPSPFQCRRGHLGEEALSRLRRAVCI